MEEDLISVAKGDRGAKKYIRVTFTDNRTICYSSATLTFMETLRSIGIDKLQNIDLEIGHLPIISQVCYPKYKAYMKEIVRGWYVNTQSNTDQKYIQLQSINNQLRLNLKIEIGTDFETDKALKFGKSKSKEHLLVKLSDGTFIGEDSPIRTFLTFIERVGIDAIRKKNLSFASNSLITITKENKSQVQLSNGQWLYIPASTKDKAKMLKVIAISLHLNIEVSVI